MLFSEGMAQYICELSGYTTTIRIQLSSEVRLRDVLAPIKSSSLWLRWLA